MKILLAIIVIAFIAVLFIGFCNTMVDAGTKIGSGFRNDDEEE